MPETTRATSRPAPSPGATATNGVIVAAAVIAVLTLPVSAVTLVQGTTEPLAPGTIVVISVALVALQATAVLCKWFPKAAFVAACALMILLAFIQVPGIASAAMFPASLAFLVPLWRLAAGDDRAWSYGALGTGLAGAVLITASDAVASSASEPLLLLAEAGTLIAAILAAWSLGALSRQRRLAEQQRLDARTRQAVSEERTRIGRDLHDIVSHSLTVMIAQAEAARVTVDDPDADRALEQVAETGRTAMGGLRRMLSVLDDAANEPLEPAPDIDAIATLAERAHTDDHHIQLTETGTPKPLAPDATLAAYRMVQECITNAIRHVLPPVEIEVSIQWNTESVLITVEDDGGQGVRPRSGSAPGTGLIGVAERVERAGGRWDERQGRGWRLRAELPVLTDADREVAS
ncbi:sensor histidine kinase [Gulosibacter molinativorax]|uniref:histidine kinase n=1 Tax=Gulosibacter molinativorax TaxID=256821 RepID=A0ABT7CAM3_9MICO|nr:histidine kinase [Gulosibacter molinativorax]MDJ1371864.1 two-component sensor histidine kinase [Gulosibacter molinativorax]QUY62513.1 Signal transduction histidine kinase [Gulosibacter molinativorax]